ncbi:hypothetical protein H3C61_04695 [Candidatus Gracilibacteria bacterium]|nr:hypothetical protein [Candidatus Gracilibacteria bacterium]
MNKKLITTLAIYSAGVITALVYNKKTPEEINKEIKDNNSKDGNIFSVFLNNFIEIHKNLLDNLKAKTLTEENKALFSEKKEELINTLKEYENKAKNTYEEYKEKSVDYKKDGIELLDKYYQEGISKIKEVDFNEIKNNFTSYIESLKNKLKK